MLNLHHSSHSDWSSPAHATHFPIVMLPLQDQPIIVHADDALTAGGSEEDEEAFVHSFHLDLRQNPEHKALLEGIFAALQRGLGKAAQHAAAWRSLSAIWTTSKASAVQQLKVARSPEQEFRAVCLSKFKSKLG